jgi:hypothetical protein
MKILAVRRVYDLEGLQLIELLEWDGLSSLLDSSYQVNHFLFIFALTKLPCQLEELLQLPLLLLHYDNID